MTTYLEIRFLPSIGEGDDDTEKITNKKGSRLRIGAIVSEAVSDMSIIHAQHPSHQLLCASS